MGLLDGLIRMLRREKKLPEAGEQTSGTERSKPLRERLLEAVPGVKGTKWAKAQKIGDYQKEYSKLLIDRDEINEQMQKIKSQLGIEQENTNNIDLLSWLRKFDEISKKSNRLEEIYAKGKADQARLTEEESLIFLRVQRLDELQKEKDAHTIRILAIRQGLINVADPEKSQLDEALKTKYTNVGEFINHQKFEAGIHFLRAMDEILEDIPDKDLMTLPMPEHMETNPRVKKAYENSNVFRQYVDILQKMNSETGFSNGTNPLVSFRFSEDPRTTGSIIIELVDEKEQNLYK